MIFPKTLKQKYRFKVLLCAFLLFFVGVSITIYSIKNFVVYYYTADEILNMPRVVVGKTYRVGGLVKLSSVQVHENSISFILSDSMDDLGKELFVIYNGALPSLFREGSGAIVEGYFNDSGKFIAKLILAKHDETYKPPTNGDFEV